MMSNDSIQRRTIDWARRRIAGKWRPYVVASMGRAGSTLVFEALVKGLAMQRFGPLGNRYGVRRIVQSWAFDLGKTNLIGGVVYKTHDFPSTTLAAADPKIVYVFGMASTAAVSVFSCLERYGPSWTDRHLAHLRANGPLEQIWTSDILRIEDQIEAWTNLQNMDVMAVRYESLWDHEKTISDFVEFSISLPARRERLTANAASDMVKRAADLYGPIDDRIAALPDVFYPPLVA